VHEFKKIIHFLTLASVIFYFAKTTTLHKPDWKCYISLTENVHKPDWKCSEAGR